MNRCVRIKFHCPRCPLKAVEVSQADWLREHEKHGQIYQRPNREMRNAGLYVLECPCMARLITNEETDFPVGTPTYLPTL